jgi:hypothetical protein
MNLLFASPLSNSVHRRFAPPLIFCFIIIICLGLAWPGTLSTARAEGPGDSAQPAATVWSHLPLVQYRNYAQLPLGTATLNQGPYTCDTSYTCYKVVVSCAQVSVDLRAAMRVGEPTILPIKGTIVFFSGAAATAYYGNFTPTNAPVLQDLRNAGYRTIEVLWDEGGSKTWYVSATGVSEGHQNLSCRPATLTQWIYDNLSEPSAPYCALGHSNGASQLAGSISFYNTADILKAAVMESGPNWSRIDQACLNDDQAFSSVWLLPFSSFAGERNNIDKAYGSGNNNGPCYLIDQNYRQQFLDSSVAFGNWRYYFTDTRVSFLFGELDTGKTAAQGKVYYDRLLAAGTPFLSTQTIVGTGHSISQTAAGATAIKDTLINTCVP